MNNPAHSKGSIRRPTQGTGSDVHWLIYGAFPLHGTARFGTARYGTAHFGLVCVSTEALSSIHVHTGQCAYRTDQS